MLPRISLSSLYSCQEYHSLLVHHVPIFQTFLQFFKILRHFFGFYFVFFFLFNLGGGGKSSKRDMITDLEFCPQVELTMRTVVHFRPITFWLCCTFFSPLSFPFLPFCAKFTFVLKLVQMQSVGIFIVYF